MEKQILEKISQQLDIVLAMLMKSQEKSPVTSGRPTKEHIVRTYREIYPNATKMDCERVTKLARKTVNKYWNQVEIKQEYLEYEDTEQTQEA